MRLKRNTMCFLRELLCLSNRWTEANGVGNAVIPDKGAPSACLQCELYPVQYCPHAVLSLKGTSMVRNLKRELKYARNNPVREEPRVKVAVVTLEQIPYQDR